MGTVNRQEEVSMIPPFLLDIQPDDACLDMCASPGSKTAQMLVALGRHWQRRAAPETLPFDYTGSRGLVVANEVDEKRSNMLVHQVKRLRKLYPFAMFTCHDARIIPPLMCNGEVRPYDKILCDVVCSGDGTLRKSPHLLRKWSPGEALGIQKLQVDIAMRGCSLLRTGGRMVYSTCSLNPIENEAVVSTLLSRTGGAMRIVDVARDLLPSLQFAPGMTSWTVTGKAGEEPSEKAHPSLFPPSADVGLAKCLRLMPHHCGGSGFFVAVLEKVREWIAPQPLDVASPTLLTAPPTYLPPPPAVVNKVAADFSVKPSFPFSHLVVRLPPGESDVARATVGMQASLLSTAVRDALNPAWNRLIVISAGLRLIAPERLSESWRIANESASIVAPFITDSCPRLIDCDRADIRKFLTEGGTLNALPFSSLPPELASAIHALPTGPLLLRIRDAPYQEMGPTCVSALRARGQVQLLVDMEDASDLVYRLGIDQSSAAAPSMDVAHSDALACVKEPPSSDESSD
mgnify:CR=1 FL=1